LPEPAPLISRLAAFVFDQVLLVPAIVLLLLWAGVDSINWESRELRTWREQLSDVAAMAGVPILALELGYFALFESSVLRGTPGKWFFGIQVGDNEGDQIGLVHTFLRAGLKLLTACFASPLFLVAAFSVRGQAPYDRLLGTTVVQRPDLDVELPPEPAKREAPPRFDGLIEEWRGPERR
jgi:uncharacterized RDD family membrane protein YckC